MAATVRSYENLSFVKVRDSGHMMPMDQPAFALEMINTWLGVGGSGRGAAASVLRRPAQLQGSRSVQA